MKMSYYVLVICGRSPHGECGLKLGAGDFGHPEQPSLPAWGVWIEIRRNRRVAFQQDKSLPAWGVWIEIGNMGADILAATRRSPHGECGLKYDLNPKGDGHWYVAPRMGSVD